MEPLGLGASAGRGHRSPRASPIDARYDAWQTAAPCHRVKGEAKNFIYGWAIPANMAKDDGVTAAKPLDDEVDEALEDEELEEGEGEEEAEEEEKAPRPTPRRAAPRASVQKRDLGEVSAFSAFSTFFVFSSLILAPVLGLMVYFMRTSESVMSIFKTAEGTFLGGIAIGLLAALVASVVFTYKAVQHA